MQGNVFLDTNIIIYQLLESKNSSDEQKQLIAIDLIRSDSICPYVSTQVLNEVSNVLLRRYFLPANLVLDFLKQIIDNLNLVHIQAIEIISAVEICDRYKFSFYDALIISSALTAKCEYLITEDMQDRQIIHHNDRQVRLINPFRE